MAILKGSEATKPTHDAAWGAEGGAVTSPEDGSKAPAAPGTSPSTGGFPVTPSEPSASTREMAINSVIKDEKYGMETLVPESLKEYRHAMDNVIKFKEYLATKDQYKEMIKGGVIVTSELTPEDQELFKPLLDKADLKEQRLTLAYQDKLSDINPGDMGNAENIYAAILKLRAEHDTTNLGIAVVKEQPAPLVDPFVSPAKPAPDGAAPKAPNSGDELIPGLEELKKSLPPGFLEQLLDNLRKNQERQEQEEARKKAPVVAEGTELGKALEKYRTLTAENAPTNTLPLVAKLNDGKDAGLAV